MRFAKKVAQIAHFWLPGWLIQSTPPHRRSPLPTRQSMQRPNEQQQRLSSWAINYYLRRLMTSWLIINIITTFIIITIIIIIITRKSSQILSEATNDKLVDYPISSLRPLAFPTRRGKRDRIFYFKRLHTFLLNELLNC